MSTAVATALLRAVDATSELAEFDPDGVQQVRSWTIHMLAVIAEQDQVAGLSAANTLLSTTLTKWREGALQPLYFAENMGWKP